MGCKASLVHAHSTRTAGSSPTPWSVENTDTRPTHATPSTTSPMATQWNGYWRRLRNTTDRTPVNTTVTPVRKAARGRKSAQCVRAPGGGGGGARPGPAHGRSARTDGAAQHLVHGGGNVEQAEVHQRRRDEIAHGGQDEQELFPAEEIELAERGQGSHHHARGARRELARGQRQPRHPRPASRAATRSTMHTRTRSSRSCPPSPACRAVG